MRLFSFPQLPPHKTPGVTQVTQRTHGVECRLCSVPGHQPRPMREGSASTYYPEGWKDLHYKVSEAPPIPHFLSKTVRPKFLTFPPVYVVETMFKSILAFATLFSAAQAHYWIQNIDGTTSCQRTMPIPQVIMNPVTGDKIQTDDVTCNAARPLTSSDIKPTCHYQAGR